MTLVESAPPATDRLESVEQYRLSLFARAFAVAVLFHLAGNARDALVTSPPLAAASVLLGVAAALTLLAPRRLGRVVAMSVLVPVTAWYEAPVVGNHWILASALSLALLVAVATSRTSGPADSLWRHVLPTARLTLLVAYAFAAFAKLNSDFFDPLVSCAVYYHNQLVGSWGLDVLLVKSGAPLGTALAVGAAVTELSVAVLLAVPRTRRVGLLLAVSFHWLLAMDLAQHFWDFSAVLFAAFLLFLDDAQLDALQRFTTRSRSHLPAVWSVGAWLVCVVGGLVTALAVLPLPIAFDVLLRVIGHLSWWLYGTTLLVAVALLARAPRPEALEAGLRPPVAALHLVPALVLLNGLTPYFEVKTGFGWNMYSNLRTAAGESNHLLVPATWPLTGLQADQVRILDSSAADLRRLRDEDYVLAYSEFREYAHGYPDVSVRYERGGQVFDVDRLADDPAGQGPVSALSARVQSFRVIDASASERCQPVFTAAR